MKKYGTPRARKGELKLQYGMNEGECDHLVVWNGDIPRCDRVLLFSLVSSKTHSPVNDLWNDSFLEELEKRGYDTKTLKISVMKKTITESVN